MRPPTWFLLGISALCLVLSLSACAAAPDTPTPTPTVPAPAAPTRLPDPSATHTALPSPTLTATSVPSLTASPTATQPPTATFTPSPTALPHGSAALGAPNLSALQELGEWGAGAVQSIWQVGDLPVLALLSSQGLDLYTADSQDLLARYPGVTVARLSPAGDQLILFYAARPDLLVVDPQTGAEIRRLEYPMEFPRYPEPGFDRDFFQTPLLAEFSWDGELMAVGYGNTDVALWRLSDGALVYALKTLLVNIPFDMQFSPSGKWLAVNGYRSLGLWNVETGELWTTLRNPGGIASQPFSLDDRLFATSTMSGVLLWNILDADIEYELPGAQDAQFADDGTHLIVYTSGDRHIHLAINGERMIRSTQAEYTPPVAAQLNYLALSVEQALALGHFPGISTLAWTEAGDLLAAGLSDAHLVAWQPFSAAYASQVLSSPALAAPALNPTTGELALCTAGSLLLWDWQAAALTELPRCRSGGLLTYSPDGSVLLRSNVLLIDLLAPQDGALLGNLRSHTLLPTSLAVSPDLHYYASGTEIVPSGAEVFIWRTAPTIGLERRLSITSQNPDGAVNVMAFSPDSSLLALGALDGLVKVYRLSDGWGLHFLNLSSPATSLVFSPDGKLLVSGTSAGQLVLWDVTSGDQLLALPAHAAELTAVLFSPDGSTLYTASADGMLRAWGIP